MKKGFTLLELLVTISIIGILVGIGSVSFSTAQRKGRDSRRQADMTAIQKSLEECYALTTSYPASVTTGGSITCSTQTVMNLVPADPKPGSSYTYTVNAGTTYCLCALMENTGSGNANSAGSGGSCSFGGTKNYFCVSNQQ